MHKTTFLRATAVPAGTAIEGAY